MVNQTAPTIGRTSKSVLNEGRSTAFPVVRAASAKQTHGLEIRATTTCLPLSEFDAESEFTLCLGGAACHTAGRIVKPSDPGVARNGRTDLEVRFTEWVSRLLATIALLCTLPLDARAAEESDYYRIVSIDTPPAQTASRSPNWKPAPEGLTLEVSGLAVLDDQRLAVAIRKGEVWILDGVYDAPPDNVTYHCFASGLHEPLGLLWHDGAFYTAQRAELTRIEDNDGDNVADAYLTAASGWGITGHYHEYAYGPKRDHDGHLWMTLNTGLGLQKDHLERTIENPQLNVRQARWRGWGMKLTPEGELLPVCAGMRSPSGIGVNADGDVFYTDQQGNWVGTSTLHHMREGAFFHHVDALASINEPGSPLQEILRVPNGLPFPEAVNAVPQLVPPAVWLPYKKVGQSPTDILLDESSGKFGPFAGQFFVGEFTQAGINRVFLEKVGGQYQGACFPFRLGFASAVLRMAQGSDGSVFVGLTNRGWSSLGTASYGLQRLVWTGKTPFEILEMRATPDGFELTFTKPLDPVTASADFLSLSSYTYFYHSAYGSDEIQRRELSIAGMVLSGDGLRLRLIVDGLRPLFVHELTAPGLRSIDGEPLLHAEAYYTLNRIP